MAEERRDRFTEVGDRYAGYQVYDQSYEKVGKVDDLFLDERDEPMYIGVKMGFLGTSSTLIPFEIVRVNDERQLVEVASDSGTIKDGPAFEDGEISNEFEERVYRHYGLEFEELPERSREMEETSYGPYYGGVHDHERERSEVDTEYGERANERPETGAQPDLEFEDHEIADLEEREFEERDREATGGLDAGHAGSGITTGDSERDEFREHPPEDEVVGERKSDLEEDVEVTKRPVQKEETRSRKEVVEEESEVDEESEHR